MNYQQAKLSACPITPSSQVPYALEADTCVWASVDVVDPALASAHHGDIPVRICLPAHLRAAAANGDFKTTRALTTVFVCPGLGADDTLSDLYVQALMREGFMVVCIHTTVSARQAGRESLS
jgi:hypothetical protein